MAEKGTLTEAAKAQIAAIVDGNGMDGRKVKVVGAKEGNAKIRGQVTVQVAGKVSTQRLFGDPPDGAEICGSRHDWQMRAKTASEDAGRDPELREQLANLVLQQPGKGWGFQTDKLKLPNSVMSFAYVEICNRCHGQGMITCPTCVGQGWLPCKTCNSTGKVFCEHCNGTGSVDTPTGKQPCNYCKGTGQMQCDQCMGKGQIQCQTCHGKTQIGCDECERHGRFAHVAGVNLIGKANFRISGKEVPPPMQKVLKTEPPTILNEHHADIDVVEQKATNQGLLFEYEVGFPLAQVNLALGKRKLPVVAFGKRSRLGAVPPFLDLLIKPGLGALEKAAKGSGNVGGHIREAAKYRLLKQALVQTLAGNGQVPNYLLEKFPHGLSTKMAKRVASLVDRSFLHITRHPRLRAVLAGTLLTPLISLGLYMIPVRDIAIKIAGHPAAGWALDAGLPILWLMLTLAGMRYVSGRALQLSLPDLFNEALETAYNTATSLTPEDGTGTGTTGAVLLVEEEDEEETADASQTKTKSGSLFGIALIGIPILHVAAIIAAAVLGGVQPDWLSFIAPYLPVEIPQLPVPDVY
ncbi:MAG: hypothetical protein KI792_13875 [Alphaproteobacteria bacterium]|nr:hypothetical protein [Alphaproteobacteria bacterium SS10]